MKNEVQIYRTTELGLSLIQVWIHPIYENKVQ